MLGKQMQLLLSINRKFKNGEPFTAEERDFLFECYRELRPFDYHLEAFSWALAIAIIGYALIKWVCS